jgi:tetratricopeptide (TPR) repeat protein
MLSMMWLACDIHEHTASDPGEIYEKALALVNEHAFRQAKPFLEQTVAAYRQINNTTKLGDALISLAQVKVQLCEFRSALDSFNEAIALKRKEGDVHGEIRALLLEGDLFAELQEYEEAIAQYRTVIASASAFDDKAAAVDAHLRLASIFQTNGSTSQALEEYKSVLPQAQALRDPQRVAAALLGLGKIYHAQHQDVEAVNSLTQALNATAASQNPLLVAQLQTELGQIYETQRSLNEALRSYRDAVNIVRRARIGKEEETVALFRVAQLYERNGKISDAQKYYTDAIESARDDGDRITENYLSIFLIRCNAQSLSPDQRVQQERQSYEQIANKFHECGHVAGEGYVYRLLGAMAEQANDLVQARAQYLKAVTLAQNTLAEYSNSEIHSVYQETLEIVRDHEDWYSSLSAVLVKLRKPEEALKIVELSRLHQLGESYRYAELTLRYPEMKQRTIDLRSRMQNARWAELELNAQLAKKELSDQRQQIAALRSELESAKRFVQDESRQIVAAHPNYEVLVAPQPMNVLLVEKYIPTGALAIEFLPTDNQLYIFAMTRSQLIVRTSAIGKNNLLNLMHEYQRLLQDPNVYAGEGGVASMPAMTRFAVLSTQLYDVLLRPVEDLLDKNLVIVSNEAMEGFPFHAVEQQDRRNNVRYVIELTSVDYVPSLASLRYRTASASHIHNVVAFGNPTGKNWSIDYELRDVRSFFHGATLRIGIEASWDNLRSVKADVLQLSTEFSTCNAEHPLGTFVLSNGLTVEESATLSFSKLSELDAVPVIFLSNQYGQGTGLTSDQALLLHLNGTSDVFLNAWTADRRAAKFFSEFFYTQLADGLAPGDAYRQALLNLIRTREVSHPRSWGQFFHFGVG